MQKMHNHYLIIHSPNSARRICGRCFFLYFWQLEYLGFNHQKNIDILHSLKDGVAEVEVRFVTQDVEWM